MKLSNTSYSSGQGGEKQARPTHLLQLFEKRSVQTQSRRDVEDRLMEAGIGPYFLRL